MLKKYMPREIKTSDILLRALRGIIRLLKGFEINYAILGGLALAVWGRERVTKDIDIIISIEEDKLNNLLDTLKTYPFRIRSSLKRIGESLLIFATYEDENTGFPIEVDLFIAQTEYQREALKRAVEIEILEQKLRIVTSEDLILYKLLANRPIDRVDAEALIEANKDNIDKTYLTNWAKRLGVAKKLKELLKKNA